MMKSITFVYAVLALCLPTGCYSAPTQAVPHPGVAQIGIPLGWTPPTTQEISTFKTFTFQKMGIYPTEIVISQSTTKNNIETSIQKTYLQCPKGTCLTLVKTIDANQLSHTIFYTLSFLSATATACALKIGKDPKIFGVSSVFSLAVPFILGKPGLIAKRLFCPTPEGADPNYEYFLLSSTTKIHSTKSIE